MNHVTAFRRAFWDAYLDRHPQDEAIGFVRTGTSKSWVPVDRGGRLILSAFVSMDRVGVFLRGEQNNAEAADAILAPLRPILDPKLSGPYRESPEARFYIRRAAFDMTDRARWPAAIDWLHGTSHEYLTTVRQALTDRRP